VDLSENQIGAAGLQAICTALALNPTVEKMQLQGNRLEEQAAQHLAALLLHHRGLKSLDLSYNQLNDLAGNKVWAVMGTYRPLVAGKGNGQDGTQLLPENINVLVSAHDISSGCPSTPATEFNEFQA
jgi:hypothetical protein